MYFFNIYIYLLPWRQWSRKARRQTADTATSCRGAPLSVRRQTWSDGAGWCLRLSRGNPPGDEKTNSIETNFKQIFFFNKKNIYILFTGIKIKCDTFAYLGVIKFTNSVNKFTTKKIFKKKSIFLIKNNKNIIYWDKNIKCRPFAYLGVIHLGIQIQILYQQI